MASAQTLGRKESLNFPQDTLTFLPDVVIFNAAILAIKRTSSSHCARVDRDAPELRSRVGRLMVEAWSTLPFFVCFS